MKHYHWHWGKQRVVSHKHEGGHKEHEHRNRKWIVKNHPLEEYGRTPAIVRAKAAKQDYNIVN